MPENAVADMFARAGHYERQGDALLAGGKKSDAIKAYKQSGSTHAALNVARMGDTSIDSVNILLEQGLVAEAIEAHQRAGRHFDAAALLEREQRAGEAVKELEAGYPPGGDELPLAAWLQ